MAEARVRPFVRRLTGEDARRLLGDGLIKLCAEEGPSRVALEVGCDEKTVRRARDGESRLSIEHLVNLAAYATPTVAPLFAAVGLEVRRIGDAPVADLHLATLLAQLMTAIAKALEDGRIDPHEVEAMAEEMAGGDLALATLRARLGAVQ